MPRVQFKASPNKYKCVHVYKKYENNKAGLAQLLQK